MQTLKMFILYTFVYLVVNYSPSLFSKTFNPPTLQSSIDRLLSVESFFILDRKAYALSSKEPSSLISLPLVFTDSYISSQKSGELPVRHALDKMVSSDLRLGGEFDKKLLLLHGDDITLSLFDPSSSQTLWTRSLPYDRIKPAPDRGGEATQFETSRLRKSFLSTWAKLDRPRLVSISKDFHSSTEKVDHFMAMTHAPDFRLLRIECKKDGEKLCETTRVCLVNDSALRKLHISGFSIHPKNKIFAVVSKGRPEVRIYDYKSCGSSKLKEIWTLPATLTSPTSVYLDSDNGVWVGTEKADDFLNASLYRFSFNEK